MDDWNLLRLDAISERNLEDRLLKQPLTEVLNLYRVPTGEVRFPLLSSTMTRWYKIAREDHDTGLDSSLETLQDEAVMKLVRKASDAKCVLVAAFEPQTKLMQYIINEDSEGKTTGVWYLWQSYCSGTGIAPLFNHKGDK